MRRWWMWVGAPIGAAVASKAGSADAGVTAAGCPGLVAQIALTDYDGTHSLPFCVLPGSFNISAGVVSLHVYDPGADGIFRNAFDAANG